MGMSTRRGFLIKHEKGEKEGDVGGLLGEKRNVGWGMIFYALCREVGSSHL